MKGRIPTGIRVYTDLDHSMLGEGGYLGPAGDEVRSLITLGVEVVPVTSKSAAEAYHYIKRLGLEESTLPAAVAESGAVIVLAGPLEPLAEERVHGAPIIPVSRGKINVDAVVPPECRGSTRILSRLGPAEASELTGLPLHEAKLAIARLYDEAVYTPDRKCRRLIEERAASLGYTVLSGRKFIHISTSPGKAAGVIRLERLVGEPRVRVLVGDSPLDKDLLELPGLAVVIPRPPGPSPTVRPSRSDYVVAPEAAPEGWVWMSRNIVKPMIPIVAHR